MSQQINLINPSLIKQKDFFTTANISIVHICMGVLMLTWFLSLKNQSAPLLNQQTQLTNQLSTLQQALSQMQMARNTEVDGQLINQIKALERKKMQQSTIINQIAKGQASAKTGVARYMRGLASQTMASVWLTGFSINQTQHAVTLKGRSLQADLLPDYMQKLGDADVFKGQSFGGLKITTPEPLDRSTQVKAEGEIDKELPEATHTIPSFVEFELQAYEIKPSAVSANNQGQT